MDELLIFAITLVIAFVIIVFALLVGLVCVWLMEKLNIAPWKDTEADAELEESYSEMFSILDHLIKHPEDEDKFAIPVLDPHFGEEWLAEDLKKIRLDMKGEK